MSSDTEAQDSTKSGYVNDFLRLRCSGDVLNIVNPLGPKSSKEISESMAMIKHIRRIALSEPMKYTIIDLCAGNALTSVIAMHLLPIKKGIAIDIRDRHRKWGNVRSFQYLNQDLYGLDNLDDLGSDLIVTATHSCKDLAKKIVDLYRKSDNATHLVVMPCCIGQTENKIPAVIRKKLGRYLAWSYDLALSADGDFMTDSNCLSPCNAIVSARKGI